MSFISSEFLIFFAVVIPLYFAIPFRVRWLYLLAASYLFYATWNGLYVLLIVASTLIDFWVARRLAATDFQHQRKRRLLLSISLISNLGTLFFFKYALFFSESARVLFAALGLDFVPPTYHVLLPIGISFYTFQALAYTIDVYRGLIPAERHLGIFATYVAFFPQLVAGPIERAGHMLPQFRRRLAFDEARVVLGLRLILWGVFKKVVIADRVAEYVNAVYNAPRDYTGLPLIVATLFFAFQIYCDFSAYSDIAIGTAKIMGFDLMLNFRQPYLSRSVREFWRRWHISLSTWFRDYLYIPLGGNRAALGRMLLNLLVVFVASGLWHGASWTFVIWGFLHGAYVVVETLVSRLLPGKPRIGIPGIALTFAAVCFAWIFFRANTIADAGYIVQHLFDWSRRSSQLLAPFGDGVLSARLTFIVSLALIGLLLVIDWLDARYNLIYGFGARPVRLRWAVYYALAAMIAWTFLEGSVTQEFIYFQF